MEELFYPWRSLYIQSFKHEPATKECVFCDALKRTDDEETLVVYRGKTSFVIMNRFPYNSGHLLIIPNRHTADFAGLTTEESEECQRLLVASSKALQELIRPHGFNLGMNLGRAAGAGIEEHLHWHIVPRWNGDTNFMPVLAEVKVVSEELTKQWRALSKSLPAFLS
jgi:ATP adenylyltransferase